jgi:hypothetical protein
LKLLLLKQKKLKKVMKISTKTYLKKNVRIQKRSTMCTSFFVFFQLVY